MMLSAKLLPLLVLATPCPLYPRLLSIFQAHLDSTIQQYDYCHLVCDVKVCPKYLSMLNHPLLPSTLLLTLTTTQRPNMYMDLHAAAAVGSTQRQLTMFAVSTTASASVAVPSPLPSRRSTQVPLNSTTVVDSPTRGRSLQVAASMIWNPGRHHPPAPSPTRSTTTHISPSSTSLQLGV